MKKNKKKIIVTGLILGSICSYLSIGNNRTYKPQYIINEECNSNTEPFASYRYGYVYIVRREQLNYMISIKNDNDIIVVDDRDKENPDMMVYNSSYIWDKDVIDDVLNILLCYEEKYPSNWNRNIESLRNEWLCHNIAYKLGYEKEDTISADLDNNEAKYFDNKILKYILKD